MLKIEHFQILEILRLKDLHPGALTLNFLSILNAAIRLRFSGVNTADSRFGRFFPGNQRTYFNKMKVIAFIFLD
jgi:hypothetical protein